MTDPATTRAVSRLRRFFEEQKRRIAREMRSTLPASKSERMKAAPTWWDPQVEDAELTATMREIYADVGTGALQNVSDRLGRVIQKGATQSVVSDLLTVGGQRIKEINDRTLQALTVEIAEGTRRGYSIPQLIDGVPDEGYRGVLQAGMDNGVAVWSDNRAETIARTETMLSYNRATLTGYGEFGITEFLAYDGDDDPECAERDGQTFPIDEAEAIEDHPNGTLVWSPIVGDQIDQQAADEAAAPEEPTQLAQSNGDAPALTQAVNDFERAIVEKAPKIEYGQAFRADGSPITGVVKGGKGSVKFPLNPAESRGSTITHFHPFEEGTVTGENFISLSREDVMTALDGRLGTIRAFAPDGRWMELRNVGYEYNSTRFKSAFDSIWADAKRGAWWAQKIVAEDNAAAEVAYQRASLAWNEAYKQALVDAVKKIGGDTLQIIEGVP